MATLQDPRIQNAKQEDNLQKSLSRVSSNHESTPLLGERSYGCYKNVKSKFNRLRCCLSSSKAAELSIIWNLIISFGLMGFLDPSFYMNLFAGNDNSTVISNIGIAYGASALVLLFYPLAGYLADVRWGRHKTVVNGLSFIFCSILLVIFLAGLATVASIPIIIKDSDLSSLNTLQTITIIILCVVFGLPTLFGLMLTFCSLAAFNANVIQFGTDQLSMHNAPTNEFVLYIHWYFWTVNVGFLLFRLPFTNIIGTPMIFILLSLIFLGITLCIQKRKTNWFSVDSGSRNPYRLVFKVLKFAVNHTHPIRRSSFTYCEDELPSRLDLGKEKYGGPFTTEQVEDVKAFLGLLILLLTTGPVFTADIAVNAILPTFVEYSDHDTNFFYASGCLTPLMIVVTIPLYLCLLRPCIHDYVPGMLKRIGIGMVLLLISGVCTLLMGLFAHNCSRPGFDEWSSECPTFLITYFNISPYYLIIQNTLNAVGYMLLHIATYEFICAQSPHSMKGLLIGTHFAIRGICQLFGAIVVYTLFTVLCQSQHKFPVCGFSYYIINIVILLIGIIAFTIVARKYQYRERDEPDNIYRYAEEYYANAQDEPNYDYDDYDNLNVQSIDS